MHQKENYKNLCNLSIQNVILGIHIDDIISIDGTAHCRSQMLFYEERRQQINKIVDYQTGGMKIESELLEAMVENAWELLKMMRIYDPLEIRKFLLDLT